MSDELKAKTPERIWLIPDGEHGFMWCNDPAPGIDMNPEDATEYVLADRITAAEARAEAAEARVVELESLVYSPGIMRCAKCSFQLYRRKLNAHSGNISAGTSETEPCPNGCGPLWPVTWKQHHHDYAEGAEQLIGELRTELDAARTLTRGGRSPKRQQPKETSQ